MIASVQPMRGGGATCPFFAACGSCPGEGELGDWRGRDGPLRHPESASAMPRCASGCSENRAERQILEGFSLGRIPHFRAI